MTKYNVASDVPVIFEVEAEDEETAIAAVEDLWGPTWELIRAALPEETHLGEWYDDTDVWRDDT